ncbi:MAG: hypothetical protein LBT51_07400 [Fusobacteriaceae bacterium]|jgi:hypothetical protein|nr:hypothetical protein [Fusobacteriaceae bacterium]
MKVKSEESSNNIRKFYFIFVFFCLFLCAKLLASDNLEKKIKKLEIEIIEFEKNNFSEEEKTPSSKTTPPKRTYSNRRPKRSKEINVNFPEYDPNTKNIAVKNQALPESKKITVDVKKLETTYPDKMLLPSENVSTKDNTVTTGIIKVNEMGNVEMFVESQNKPNIENNLKDISIIGNNKLIDNKESPSNGDTSPIIEESDINSSEKVVFVEEDINIKIEIFDYINKTGNIIN